MSSRFVVKQISPNTNFIQIFLKNQVKIALSVNYIDISLFQLLPNSVK